MYKVNEVKAVCDRIYGKEIAPSTWRKWRKLTGVGAIEAENGGIYIQRKTYSDKQAYYLTAYTYFKRLYPYKKVNSLTDVLNELKNHKNIDELKFVQSDSDGVKGANVPEYIRQVYNRKVSLRTVYRIAKLINIQFSINSYYSKIEIEKFSRYFD